MIGIASIRHVDRTAEIAEQCAAPQRTIGAEQRQEGVPLHLGNGLHAEQIEECRSEIDGLGQSTPAGAGSSRPARIVQEERDVHDLLIHIHPVLRPEIVLP
ncbi:hypothetical protein D9M72_540990 [compost metagenome]